MSTNNASIEPRRRFADCIKNKKWHVNDVTSHHQVVEQKMGNVEAKLSIVQLPF